MPFERFIDTGEHRRRSGRRGKYGARFVRYPPQGKPQMRLGLAVAREIDAKRVRVLFDPDTTRVALEAASSGEANTWSLSSGRIVSVGALMLRYHLDHLFDNRFVPCSREGDRWVFSLLDPEVEA